MDATPYVKLYETSCCFGHWAFYCTLTAIRNLTNTYRLIFLHLTFGTKWFLHSSQRYGRCPVWIRWCNFIFSFVLNVLLHSSQRYECTPICIIWLNSFLRFVLNVLLHSSQRYERSPVRIRWCNFILQLILKFLMHSWKRYGPSPVRKRWWNFNSRLVNECFIALILAIWTLSIMYIWWTFILS